MIYSVASWSKTKSIGRLLFYSAYRGVSDLLGFAATIAICMCYGPAAALIFPIAMADVHMSMLLLFWRLTIGAKLAVKLDVKLTTG